MLGEINDARTLEPLIHELTSPRGGYKNISVILINDFNRSPLCDEIYANKKPKSNKFISPHN
jgi:hypothetical protein